MLVRLPEELACILRAGHLTGRFRANIVALEYPDARHEVGMFCLSGLRCGLAPGCLQTAPEHPHHQPLILIGTDQFAIGRPNLTRDRILLCFLAATGYTS